MIKNNFLKNKKHFHFENSNGFSILEILVSIAIFSLILLSVVSFLSLTNLSNSQTKADREVLGNARKTLEEIAFEIRSAKSIYTPTTTVNQLSLETSRYLPPNESNTFIDFFLCGTAVCFKKEFQDPVVLTPDNVRVTNLTFSQILTGSVQSIKINMTVSYVNNTSFSGVNPSVDLTSTASLRSY